MSNSNWEWLEAQLQECRNGILQVSQNRTEIIDNYSCIREESNLDIEAFLERGISSNAFVRTNKWHIYAIKSGVVILNYFSSDYYGHSVLIKDDDKGQIAHYAHLAVHSSLSLNSRITEGQVIGVMGNTGNSSSKHLHVSVYPAGTTSFFIYNAIINPEVYIIKGTYPANTKISGWFGEEYRRKDGSKYNHEGTDFSGLEKNLIPGWRFGITGATGMESN